MTALIVYCVQCMMALESEVKEKEERGRGGGESEPCVSQATALHLFTCKVEALLLYGPDSITAKSYISTTFLGSIVLHSWSCQSCLP